MVFGTPADVINKFQHGIVTLCWNKALWLFKTCHMACKIQSECIISAWRSSGVKASVPGYEICSKSQKCHFIDSICKWVESRRQNDRQWLYLAQLAEWYLPKPIGCGSKPTIFRLFFTENKISVLTFYIIKPST